MAAVVRGRANVAPNGTHVRLGNENNMSAHGILACEVHVKPVSADDGQAVDTKLQKVRARVPGWLIHVFRDAGSTQGERAGLPDMISVAVSFHPVTRTVVSIDIDRAVEECQPYRAYGLDEWKHADSVLAPVRNAFKLPRLGWRALKSVPAEVREAIDSLRPTDGPPKPSWKPSEVDEIRRTARLLALRYELHPDEHQRARTASLQALPLHVQSFVAGAIHQDDFEALVMQAEVSTSITPDEAAEYRRQAGLA